MKYSPYYPDTMPTAEEINKNQLGKQYIDNCVRLNNLILLKSDYYGIDSYYYDNKLNVM